MGNLLMMEPLLSLFKEFKQSQMATTASQSLFLSTMKQPSPQPFSSKKIIAQTQADISDPYILAHGENTTQKFNINIQSMENKDHFISSNYVMKSLVSTMTWYGVMYPLCGYPLELPLLDMVKHEHVALISMGRIPDHFLWWNSMSITGRKYTANLR